MTRGFIKTTDVCDAHPDGVRVAEPIFRDFGGRCCFAGPVSTLKLHEDNSLVRLALSEPGGGRVLVIDGGGSMRRALVGDQLAALGRDNGWAGVVVYGCVRDAADLRDIALGIKALGTHPRRSDKKGVGERDVPVTFAGVTFFPGHYLVADDDGVVLCDEPPA